MESNNLRSPSVLNDLDMNIQDDSIKKTSPSSLPNTLKSSSNFSVNAKEVDDDYNQENKPPTSLESTPPLTDGFIFKKPLPRETMANEDNVLSSLIDDLSHLKLGATPVNERRFNACKWTTPLKRKAARSDDSCSSSECSSMGKNNHHSAPANEVYAENATVDLSSAKSDKETVTSQNGDDCSDYYDCSDDGNVISEETRVNNITSDHCNTADSSFHSISEKEHTAELDEGNSTFVNTDSEPVNEATLAEMNRSQGKDEAFILEKYLTEQDFKLEFNLSDTSFNAVTAGVTFEFGKRESICTQTENPASSLFGFEPPEKPALCFTEYQSVNNVTIQADQFDKVASFTKENDMQTEESLFNLISDYLVQNETRSSFVTESEENIFTLGGIPETGSLRIDTVDLEDALMQPSVRKSLLLESNDSNVDQNDVNESEIRDSQPQTGTTSPVQEIAAKIDAEIETVNDNNESREETSSNEICDSTRVSFSQPIITDQFESDDVNKSDETSVTSAIKSNETVILESSQTNEDTSIGSNQSTVVAECNDTATLDSLESITTIDEIVTEINKNSKKLNETMEFSRRTCSPSSLNATIDTESIGDDSFYEQSGSVVDSETNQNIDENDSEQNNYETMLNCTADLELSQNFHLEIEQTPSRKSFYQTNSTEIQTGEDLVEQSPELNQSLVSETTSVTFEKAEVKNSESAVNETVNLEEIEVTHENLEKSIVDKLNESVDLNRLSLSQYRSPQVRRFRPIHNVDFFLKDDPLEKEHNKSLEIAQAANDTLSETKSNEETSNLKIVEISNEKINEENSTISADVETLAEQCQKLVLNETVNLEKTDSTEENIIRKIEEVLNKSVDLNTISITRTSHESRIRPIHNVEFFIKADPREEERNESSSEISDNVTNEKSSARAGSEIIPAAFEHRTEESTDLPISESANLEMVDMIDENAQSEVEDYFNKSANIKSLLSIEDDIALCKMRCTPMRSVRFFDQIIEDEIEKKANKSSLESAQIPSQDIVDPNEESLKFNQTDDLEVTRVIEKVAEDVTESDNLDRTTNLETGETSRIEHSESIQTSPRGIDEKIGNISVTLNKTVDLEATRIIDDEPEKFVAIDERINLETTQTIENESSAMIEDSSPSNKISEMFRKNSGKFVTFDMESGTLNFEEPTSPCANEPPELDKDIIMKIAKLSYEGYNRNGTDACTETADIESCGKQNITDVNLSSNEAEITVVLTHSSEEILKSSPSRFEIADDLSTSITTPALNQNEDMLTKDSVIELTNEVDAVSSDATEEQTPEQSDLLNVSNIKSCDATVIIHGSPSPQRSNSPARFDIHAVQMDDIASPIPPNSPTELSNKWRTQVDLSSVADHLEDFNEHDSPSNSSDEMDVTDPVDSNIAPEMLQMMKLPPGINRSYSNLESIPEINENETSEEQNASEVDLEQDNTNDRKSCLAINIQSTELEPESATNQTVILTSSEAQPTENVLNSTQVVTSSQLVPEPEVESEPKPEFGFDKSTITFAPVDPNELIFKTPIRKLPPQSDLSAIYDSSFNADYCSSARSVSAKSTPSAKHSLVSPKQSFFRNSPTFYSAICTPKRKLKHASPKVSSDAPAASLLDMSIGYFEKYTATQTGATKSSGDEVNKSIDVDDEPQLEETKLLYIEEPNKKVNVKTQTHDTELLDLREENAKLKEDIRELTELTQAMAATEAELRTTLQNVIHNEIELKKAAEQHEENNRLLHNRYEILKDYSNELLTKRNEELDRAENRIRFLEAQLEKYTKNSEASSK
ncbi:uncharacterized protein LOC135833018 [Planococcus citri]|uniref:uncharacterized protein LOC135833018 n=1 Tax=Planococcus citri TaxID=170843 RepID=UPI0031F80CEF